MESFLNLTKNIGIGTDIESNIRFHNLEKENEVIKKIFTEKEIEYCYFKKYPAQHFCAKFCAKEATIKALSGIAREKLTLKDIEILNYDDGIPFVTIKKEGFENIFIKVSLSHCEDKSVAFTLAMKGN